ncbi:MAG TPA: GNAT family N-acetyltransferase [Terriglobales bacterium]|nr:GNAT family N-acetyltransferase [Terriglobales bacterium]
MGAFLTRPAMPSEQKELEQLQLRASLGNVGDRDALLAHPDAIGLGIDQIARCRVFVAECEGKIVGFAAVEPREDGDGELDAMFVEPRMQRRGIGRTLVEYCAEVARKQGSRYLHVVGNPHAENFYLATGFEVIGMTQTRFGPGLLMRRAVSCS